MLRFARVGWRDRLVIGTTALSLCGVGYGLYRAVHSPLFLLRVVEIADLPERAPVDVQTITDLAAAPIGKASLFNVDLGAIERRILSNPWIRAVHLSKRFPQTLSIAVEFRHPRAILEKGDGALSYVDPGGNVFGRVNLELPSDLPILSGFHDGSGQRINEALQLLETWSQTPLASLGQIASISFDAERGFRALVTYPLVPRGRGRAMVELGQEFDAEFDASMNRLGSVIQYLSAHGLSARQIWADAGKKIVVKIAHGS